MIVCKGMNGAVSVVLGASIGVCCVVSVFLLLAPFLVVDVGRVFE